MGGRVTASAPGELSTWSPGQDSLDTLGLAWKPQLAGALRARGSGAAHADFALDSSNPKVCTAWGAQRRGWVGAEVSNLLVTRGKDGFAQLVHGRGTLSEFTQRLALVLLKGTH